MTLKARNKILTVFLFFSIFCILAGILSLVIALLNKAITPPPVLRIPNFLNSIPFLKYNFSATIISIISLTICVPFIVFYVLKFFEATQSTEIIFFIGFLTACLAEIVRILTPLFGLWSTFSNLLFFCGRVLFMGRLLAPLSFVFAAIASSPEKRQEVEQNLFIMFIIAIVFSISVPINTAKISSAGAVTWGFPYLFFVLRIACIILSFITFILKGINDSSEEYKKIAFSMIILFSGYSILQSSDNFAFLITGLPLFSIGIFGYLRNLHKLYMWQ